MALLWSVPAAADLDVRFVEGAPKDRFELVNTSACATGPISVRLDLSGSAGGLIFDVTEAGAGVEVFQPFELAEGADALAALPSVADGDDVLTLDLIDLPADTRVSFTIDVDDTLGGREITVSGAEIEGALVTARLQDRQVQSQFTAEATARLGLASCIS
ncbi:aggregation factor core [Thalassococcus sp. S3]|nr:aggregation factor core [Thalassococcus sp. S3]